jgi:hypothetical protein
MKENLRRKKRPFFISTLRRFSIVSFESNVRPTVSTMSRNKLSRDTWRTYKNALSLNFRFLLTGIKTKEICPCDKPWRPTGLWDVEAPTFSRQSAHRWRWGFQLYAPANRPSLTSQEDSWVDSRAIVRLEWLIHFKNCITTSVIEPATFRFVA